MFQVLCYALAYHMGTNKIVRTNYLNRLNLDVCNIQKREFRLRSDNYWGTEKLNERIFLQFPVIFLFARWPDHWNG